MRRILWTILGLLIVGMVSLVTSNNATAGESYGDGYVTRGAVSYSSNCCYRKVVRYVRTVRYVRVRNRVYGDTYAPPYRSSYYGTPYRTVYYGEPYRQPYRYYDGGYPAARVSYRARYDENCAIRRVRIADVDGNWVWARLRVCD